jgi:hypothetical protein
MVDVHGLPPGAIDIPIADATNDAIVFRSVIPNPLKNRVNVAMTAMTQFFPKFLRVTVGTVAYDAMTIFLFSFRK